MDTDWNPLVPELTVADLDASLRFYALCGFRVRFRRDDPPFAYLALGGAQLMLEQLHDGGWRTGALERPFGRGLNLQVEVPALAPIAERLAAAGHAAFRAPAEAWYAVDGGREEGQLEGLWQDPDAYLLRFVEVLGSRPG